MLSERFHELPRSHEFGGMKARNRRNLGSVLLGNTVFMGKREPKFNVHVIERDIALIAECCP